MVLRYDDDELATSTAVQSTSSMSQFTWWDRVERAGGEPQHCATSSLHGDLTVSVQI